MCTALAGWGTIPRIPVTCVHSCTPAVQPRFSTKKDVVPAVCRHRVVFRRVCAVVDLLLLLLLPWWLCSFRLPPVPVHRMLVCFRFPVPRLARLPGLSL